MEKYVEGVRRRAHELSGLKNAPNLDRRKDWARGIYEEGTKFVDFDQLSLELGLSLFYLGYEEKSNGNQGKIKCAIMQYGRTIDEITVDVDREKILVDGVPYADFIQDLSIGRVVCEVILQIQTEYIESL